MPVAGDLKRHTNRSDFLPFVVQAEDLTPAVPLFNEIERRSPFN